MISRIPPKTVECLIQYGRDHQIQLLDIDEQGDLLSQYECIAHNVTKLLITEPVNQALKEAFGDLLLHLYNYYRQQVQPLNYTDFRSKASTVFSFLPADEKDFHGKYSNPTAIEKETRIKSIKKKFVNEFFVRMMFGEPLSRHIDFYCETSFCVAARPKLEDCPHLVPLDCLLARRNLLPEQISIKNLMISDHDEPHFYSKQLNIFTVNTDDTIIYDPSKNTVNKNFKSELKPDSQSPLKLITSPITGCHVVIIHCQNSGVIYFSHVSPSSINGNASDFYLYGCKIFAYDIFENIPADENVSIVIVDMHGFYDENRLRRKIKANIVKINKCSFPQTDRYVCAFTPNDNTVHTLNLRDFNTYTVINQVFTPVSKMAFSLTTGGIFSNRKEHVYAALRQSCESKVVKLNNKSSSNKTVP